MGMMIPFPVVAHIGRAYKHTAGLYALGLSGRSRKYGRTERCDWWMPGKDAGPDG